jgi:cytochrome c-type biogenesis protein CcmH/NrfG
MNFSQIFWFTVGVLSVLAVLIVTYPWLAGKPRAQLLGALPRWVPAVAVAALVGALALYLRLGSPQLNERDSLPSAVGDASGSTASAAPSASATSSKTAGSMDSAVTGLEKRLASGGGTGGDWELLAKSYEFLGRPDDAALARKRQLPAGAGSGAPVLGEAPVGAPAAAPLSAAASQLIAAAAAARAKRDFAAARAAYVKLVARKEMTADTWADYADVAAATSGNSLIGLPATYIQNALRLDPRHAKALWLQASLEHESHQYAAAVTSWQKLAAVLGSGAEDAKLIAANMAEDQRLAGGGAPAATPGAGAGAGAPAAGVVRGEVVLADALRGKVPAGLTLFILAKSVNSPGAPVAILRLTTGSWPVSFQLDDSLAMLPGRKLSTAGPVTIEARTSKSGQAMPAAGDFQGATAPLDPSGAKSVRVVIQRVIG